MQIKEGDTVRANTGSLVNPKWVEGRWGGYYRDHYNFLRSDLGWVNTAEAGLIVCYTMGITLMKPALDLTKPMQTRNGKPRRVLCTDAPGRYPIIVLDDTGYPWCYPLSGENPNAVGPSDYDLVNVPPKPAAVELTVMMKKRASDGRTKIVHSQYRPFTLHETDTWKIVAKKTFTITEGEGME